MEKLPEYRVYLLRCWQERSQKEPSQAKWNFTIEDPKTRQRHGFPDLDSLTAFLKTQLDCGSDGEEKTPEV
ncbi:hypothetical protein [Candidatus Chloroploca sp. Khr17]|uniref:hypothetical protein n=1 Tax=Candidatus Chloroploca sp. Khr17 TaxID=2496869 RepID=UPI00101DF63F|nr:hypothetical protein [Candidatus Chloroploca sp. Khr17]